MATYIYIHLYILKNLCVRELFFGRIHAVSIHFVLSISHWVLQVTSASFCDFYLFFLKQMWYLRCFIMMLPKSTILRKCYYWKCYICSQNWLRYPSIIMMWNVYWKQGGMWFTHNNKPMLKKRWVMVVWFGLQFSSNIRHSNVRMSQFLT